MGDFIWTERAIQGQSELNRLVDGLRRDDPTEESTLQMFSPRLVKTRQTIAIGASGTCEFLKGRFATLKPTGRTETMYNMVIDDVIKPDQICLAVQAGAEESGEDGWILLRVVTATTTTETHTLCSNCDGGVLPSPIALTAKGFTDGATSAGTADLINGTHSLVDAASESGITAAAEIVDCTRALRITDTASGSGEIIIELSAGSAGWIVRIGHDEAAFSDHFFTTGGSATNPIDAVTRLVQCDADYDGDFADHGWDLSNLFAPSTALGYSAMSISISP